MNQTEKTYQQNYQILESVVQQLSQNQNIDIDQLLPMVDQASEAYKFCKSRIDAVESALSERFNQQDLAE